MSENVTSPDSDFLTRFIQACKQIQPEQPRDILRFFEGVVGFPYDKELLLQAYVHLNINQYLPRCDRLLLFEKSPDLAHRTDLGKCDFVYLTQENTLTLIETKYIDLDAHGTTAQRRRTKKRKEVVAQVDKLKLFFRDYWSIAPETVECAVFTTDPSLASRAAELGIRSEWISIEALFEWQQFQHQRLKTLSEAEWIYHICPQSDWLTAKEMGFYSASSLATEGFIHCSLTHQVQNSLQLHFQGQTNLLLLTIDPNLLTANLRHEVSRNGEYFPHLYGVLNLEAVKTVSPIQPSL